MGVCTLNEEKYVKFSEMMSTIRYYFFPKFSMNEFQNNRPKKPSLLCRTILVWKERKNWLITKPTSSWALPTYHSHRMLAGQKKEKYLKERSGGEVKIFSSTRTGQDVVMNFSPN